MLHSSVQIERLKGAAFSDFKQPAAALPLSSRLVHLSIRSQEELWMVQRLGNGAGGRQTRVTSQKAGHPERNHLAFNTNEKIDFSFTFDVTPQTDL